ncbi:efflux RND transporter periplasmic adaptor subunit [Foetidibacter luteolus]|uniref:efflux RND transporter periplasmic adaptor subunit n=1 Tax=Foetidibacter luteolus TaxID=2608880 RepID=UPI00129ABC72|nr:HlyD family efflux transporter periplasmic adaptor subunit [Foetidibacter luteolus]
MNLKFISFCIILFCSCGQPQMETVTPVIAPVTEAVFATGHIEAADQVTLTALNDGYITKAFVQEGDTVKPGQVLFAQDNSTAVIQQQAANEDYAITRQQAAANSAVMLQLQAQLASATEKMENDKVQMERMQRLYATHSVAKIDFDNAKLSFGNSENTVAGIKENITATSLNLQQALVSSRAQQQSASANTGYYNLKSPAQCVVFSVFKKPGELVRKGEAVALLGNKGQLMIKLNIDEGSITKIKPNQKVLVELNTAKSATYTATVSKIYPLFDEASQSYIADAVFDKPAAGIINGTLLQANVIIAQKSNAMLLPRNCLTADGKFLLQKSGRVDTVAVQTGIVSNEWVEVLDGLQPTDKVINVQ